MLTGMFAAYRYMNDKGRTTPSAIHVNFSFQRFDPGMYTAETYTLLNSRREPDTIIFNHNFEVSGAEEDLYSGF